MLLIFGLHRADDRGPVRLRGGTRSGRQTSDRSFFDLAILGLLLVSAIGLVGKLLRAAQPPSRHCDCGGRHQLLRAPSQVAALGLPGPTPRRHAGRPRRPPGDGQHRRPGHTAELRHRSLPSSIDRMAGAGAEGLRPGKSALQVRRQFHLVRRRLDGRCHSRQPCRHLSAQHQPLHHRHRLRWCSPCSAGRRKATPRIASAISMRSSSPPRFWRMR